MARIWLEGELDEKPVWRGHVRHVQGKEETYFQDMEAMNEFLARVSGLPGLKPTGWLSGEAGAPKPGKAATRIRNTK